LTRGLGRGLALGLVVLAACSSATGDTSTASSAADEPTTTTSTVVEPETGSTELGPADRPARLVAPDEVTAPAPLLVLLHGYGADAAGQDAYLGVTEQAASRGLYVLLPDGTMSDSGKRFWDSEGACCNFSSTPVDDVAYLSGLIDEALAERPIDPDRVYLFGHSNGGFMSYRMACDAADRIAAVAVLAGSDAPEADDCAPSEPVSVLHLHGTDDRVIEYAGGTITTTFPGALETIDRWVERDGCDEDGVERPALDLDTGIAGDETTVVVHEGCADGALVQLDTLQGGGHVPSLSREAVGTQVLDWLLARAR
jgi:polyhydroxybutyrate depolymerase